MRENKSVSNRYDRSDKLDVHHFTFSKEIIKFDKVNEASSFFVGMVVGTGDGGGGDVGDDGSSCLSSLTRITW